MRKRNQDISEAVEFAKTTLALLAQLRKKASGKLKCWHGQKGNRYYVKDGDGYRYIKKDEIGTARDIAQQEYDEALAKELAEMVECGEKFLQMLADPPWIRLFERLSPAKQALVKPLVQSGDERAKEWLAINSDNTLVYEPEKKQCASLKGNLFRSKSEASMADLFDSYNLTYVYERAVFLEIPGKTIYPDFTIYMPHTGRVITWEHFGMADNKEYVANMIYQINLFIKNGFRLGVDFFFTIESHDTPLDRSTVIAFIEQIIRDNE